MATAIRGPLEFDFKILLLEFELRNRVLFHQVDNGLNVFQIHRLLQVRPAKLRSADCGSLSKKAVAEIRLCLLSVPELPLRVAFSARVVKIRFPTPVRERLIWTLIALGIRFPADL